MHLKWTDPSTWPWSIYLWIAVMLSGFLKPAWRWFQRRRAADWPIAPAQIESADVIQPKPTLFSTRGRSAPYAAELTYSYVVAGERNAGWHRRDLATEDEAYEFVGDLKGKPVMVHYDQHRPSRSVISEPSLDALLQNRAPVLARGLHTAADSIPAWIRPLLWPFTWLAGIGLAVSLWVHLGAVMGRRVAPEAFFWILHIGIFVVWFPAVLVAQRTAGNVNRKDSWKIVLRGTPEWMRYMVYGFFGYAVINFLLFVAKAPTGSGGTNPPAVVWRGFSGHWMAFYFAALAILSSAASGEQERWECPNGHSVSSTAHYCERCGQAISPRQRA